jgi:clan AA aspartic protease (TIGR02281 family)
MTLPAVHIFDKPGAKVEIGCKPNLQELFWGHRWFDLRDAVHQVATEGFYRGAVACAFNEFPQCRQYLAAVIDSAPHSQAAYEAHDLLAWAYVRRGMFRHALANIDAMLAIKPGYDGPRAMRALLLVLSRYQEQSIRRRHSSILHCTMVEGNIFIPVAVNGTPANFMIDSGATISMITQSEAKRLELTLQKVDATAKLYGATGAAIGFDVAVAARLSVGKSHLSNVSFLVLNDDQFQFPPDYAGALGLPVLIGLQTLSWSTHGKVHINCAPKPPDLSKANVCFDGPELVTEAIFQEQKLPLVMDTGSGMTVLGPEFAAKFMTLVRRSGRKTSILLSGVSGSAKVESVCLPRIALQMPGFEGVLRAPHVLLKPTTPNSAWLFGRLGIDFLKQADRVTLDFNCMRLTLEHRMNR